MRNFNFISLIVLITLLTSCDKIEEGKYKKPFVRPDTKRKILLEDWTGHQCGNCPKAGLEVARLDSIFGENLVIMGIHAGFFARTNTTGEYTYDFTNPESRELEILFRLNTETRPLGMVNRMKFNSSDEANKDHILPSTTWESIITEELNKLPDAEITLNVKYDSISNTLSDTVITKFLSDLEGSYKLAVYITEDNIINWQTWYLHTPQDVPDYKHRHVFRGSQNGTLGTELINGTIEAGKEVKKTFSYNLKAGWKAKNCAVVAFVYDANTYEILQAEEKKIVP